MDDVRDVRTAITPVGPAVPPPPPPPMMMTMPNISGLQLSEEGKHRQEECIHPEGDGEDLIYNFRMLNVSNTCGCTVVDKAPPRPPLPREGIPPQRPPPPETDDEDEVVFRTMPQADQPIKVREEYPRYSERIY